MKIHKSCFGYHPCDHETFLKLKEAHLLFLRALRDIRAYERWERKQEPEGEAPTYPSFVCQCGYFYRSRLAQERGQMFYGYTVGCEGERLSWGSCEVQFYERLLEQYRNVRAPRATPEEVKPLDLPDDFWKTVEKLKGFYEVSQKDARFGVAG